MRCVKSCAWKRACLKDLRSFCEVLLVQSLGRAEIINQTDDGGIGLMRPRLRGVARLGIIFVMRGFVMSRFAHKSRVSMVKKEFRDSRF